MYKKERQKRRFTISTGGNPVEVGIGCSRFRRPFPTPRTRTSSTNIALPGIVNPNSCLYLEKQCFAWYYLVVRIDQGHRYKYVRIINNIIILLPLYPTSNAITNNLGLWHCFCHVCLNKDGNQLERSKIYSPSTVIAYTACVGLPVLQGSGRNAAWCCYSPCRQSSFSCCLLSRILVKEVGQRIVEVSKEPRSTTSAPVSRCFQCRILLVSSELRIQCQ